MESGGVEFPRLSGRCRFVGSDGLRWRPLYWVSRRLVKTREITLGYPAGLSDTFSFDEKILRFSKKLNSAILELVGLVNRCCTIFCATKLDTFSLEFFKYLPIDVFRVCIKNVHLFVVKTAV